MFHLPNNDREKKDLRAIGIGVNRPSGSLSWSSFHDMCLKGCVRTREFAFCRGRRDDGELPTILLVAPVSEHPVPAVLERLEHEYSLREELDSEWAARPLTLVRREGRPMRPTSIRRKFLSRSQRS